MGGWGEGGREWVGEVGGGASTIVQGVVGEGSRRRLLVPLLTTRAP